jgi:hypothetical protein
VSLALKPDFLFEGQERFESYERLMSKDTLLIFNVRNQDSALEAEEEFLEELLMHWQHFNSNSMAKKMRIEVKRSEPLSLSMIRPYKAPEQRLGQSKYHPTRDSMCFQ